jgi:epoxyqueuosine reductase
VRLADWLGEDGDSLLERYDRLYVPRNDPRYLRRNALVALGNIGTPEDASLADPFLGNDDELLREQAEWALARIEKRHG